MSTWIFDLFLIKNQKWNTKSKLISFYLYLYILDTLEIKKQGLGSLAFKWPGRQDSNLRPIAPKAPSTQFAKVPTINKLGYS